MLRLAELAARECDGKDAFSVPVLIAAKRQCRLEVKMREINQPTLTPETAVTFTAFVESVYLPHSEQRMPPSTYRGYKVLCREIKPFCEGL
jgi:hypothetical protein